MAGRRQRPKQLAVDRSNQNDARPVTSRCTDSISDHAASARSRPQLDKGAFFDDISDGEARICGRCGGEKVLVVARARRGPSVSGGCPVCDFGAVALPITPG